MYPEVAKKKLSEDGGDLLERAEALDVTDVVEEGILVVKDYFRRAFCCSKVACR